MSARVLLVDDNDANRLTLSALLESEAFRVTQASSLAEARQALRDSAGFDLVLLDRQLGDGLGIELIPLIRAGLPGSKIILVSGSTSRDAGRTSEEVDAYFDKGDDLDELLHEMSELLPP